MSKFEDSLIREWRHDDFTNSDRLLVRFIVSTRMNVDSEDSTPERLRRTEEYAVKTMRENILDILEVEGPIRCYECSYSQETINGEFYCKRSFRTGSSNGYCSWARRR